MSARQDTVSDSPTTVIDAPETSTPMVEAKSNPNRSRYPYVVSIGTNTKGYYNILSMSYIFKMRVLFLYNKNLNKQS